MRKLWIILILTLGILGLGFVSAQEVDERYVGTIPAPDFPAGLDWINSDSALTLTQLQGKIIILDFWTYGCINCIHMIPVFRQLEETYPNEVVVIGVHSAKFANEGETENIRQIVQRYQLTHPVINDSDFIVWRTYGIQAWPTLMVIDPRGNVVASQAGEVPFEALDSYIGSMLAYYDALGTNEINREPLALALEGAGNPGTPLLYPGKVVADVAGNRLFIADSNHHRIVVADLTTYEVLAVIGNGQRGNEDGDYTTAMFDQPQGMEINGDTLYIADTNNHTIRAVDLANQQVTTIAGSGYMGRGLIGFGNVIDRPLFFDLRSPWDVALGANNILYIAMAGMHQIWQLDLTNNILRPSVGNGYEAQSNSTLAQSALAQPSGLHYQQGLLYFADSESSTIRVADFNTDRVMVVSGTTEDNLFDYGDVDGIAGVSRLQHALGVTANEDGSLLYIADTYNSKIKVYDRASGETTTFAGIGGNGGYRDGDLASAQFDEPGGIDYANGQLYIADTNNHVIRVIDLASNTVSTVTFPNPEALRIPDQITVLGGNASEGLAITLDTATVSAGEGNIQMNINLPEGYKLNPLISSFVAVTSNSASAQLTSDQVNITGAETLIPVTFSQGMSTIQFEVTLYYCEAQDESYCLVDDVSYTLPVSISPDAEQNSISIVRDVVVPEGFAGN